MTLKDFPRLIRENLGILCRMEEKSYLSYTCISKLLKLEIRNLSLLLIYMRFIIFYIIFLALATNTPFSIISGLIHVCIHISL